MGMHPPPSPAWANFTLMIECTLESSRCYSVYSVVLTVKSTIGTGGGWGRDVVEYGEEIQISRESSC